MSFDYSHFGNAALIEELYTQYQRDPSSVDVSWRRFFEGIEFGGKGGAPSRKAVLEGADLRLYFFIEACRREGHQRAQFNPLSAPLKEEVEELRLERFGLKASEGESAFPTYGFLPAQSASLNAVVAAVRATYEGGVGFEYMHCKNPQLRSYIQERVEPGFSCALSREMKKRILSELNRSEIFEAFLHRKYAGQKRFSLEGGESLIPMLQEGLSHAATRGVRECNLGMSHRGRLNVLANVLGKSYSAIFGEFEGVYLPDTVEGSGDVKYHKGYSGTSRLEGGGELKISLEANPSHLESVNPVLEGRVRARGEISYEGDFKPILPILIHGDGAIAGQGVVYETIQLCALEGYSTGGTLHIVINNQVGFTAKPSEMRSTPYCTDIALSFEAPIFHVNGENPEECVQVMLLAIDLRQQFGCDVFIDLNCYRKYGHNETDEPAFTQPLLYQQIQGRPLTRNLYRDCLLQEGALTEAEAEELEKQFLEELAKAEEEVRAHQTEKHPSPLALSESKEVVTAVDSSQLIEWARGFTRVPEGLHVHPKVLRLLQERLKACESEEGRIDWGLAEHFAYASLLATGHRVRLSGEDSRRGTFSHRHAALIDQVNEAPYFPLSHIAPSQAPFAVYNSCLSEFAVMGFEFGYSLIAKEALIIWEGQFGDFANGAQTIIDQYIVASEQKWGYSSNLVLMLPHGYEGMGPEHSSARIERFLQLCAEDNMRVAIPSTPAQLFHLLRRQALNPLRKPLIYFSPKALLRYPPSLSPLIDFTKGSFQEVIGDPVKSAKKVLFCTGKVYYDLTEARAKQGREDVAIIRVEQLYPFPKEEIKNALHSHPSASLFWVQEEPQNMGAWSYIDPLFREVNTPLNYVGRLKSASPAAGSHALHQKELSTLLEEAFK